LPDLTRVKSGRACLPLCRRVPRPPRQARPDYWRQAWGGPLACGLAPFGNRTAKTLPRSVFGRSSGGDLPGGVSPRLQRGICRPQFFGVFLRHCARAHPGRPLPPRPARRATLDPDRPPVDLKWLDSGGAADEAGSCSSPNMMLCHRLRCLMAPPSFLPDLTRVKSGHCPDGRACDPAAPRARRSSRKSSTGRFLIAHHPPAGAFSRPPRQARPDYWRQVWGGPLACGLAPFGNRTAKTLPRSVFRRSSGGDLPGGVSPRLQQGICGPQFFGVFLRHCARAHPGRPLPPRPARRATLDPDRPPVDLKWLDSGGAADEAGSCSSPNMMFCHRLRCLMAPPSFLPDLTRVKSGHCPDGRACDPAAPRARRSSRKSSTGRFLIAHHPRGRRVAAPAQAGTAGLPPSCLGRAPCLRACALRQSGRKNAPPERFQAVLWGRSGYTPAGRAE
jgi:hypothetical protein